MPFLPLALAAAGGVLLVTLMGGGRKPVRADPTASLLESMRITGATMEEFGRQGVENARIQADLRLGLQRERTAISLATMETASAERMHARVENRKRIKMYYDRESLQDSMRHELQTMRMRNLHERREWGHLERLARIETQPALAAARAGQFIQMADLGFQRDQLAFQQNMGYMQQGGQLINALTGAGRNIYDIYRGFSAPPPGYAGDWRIQPGVTTSTGATAMGAISGAAQGAAAGTAVYPGVGTAVGAAAGAGASMS